MTRKTFLTLASLVPILIGAFAALAPGVLLETVKVAAPSPSANVMARTAGVLLITVGTLNFLVRGHADSPTLRAILIADLLLQILLLPIDPLAYYAGTFGTVGSFVPNTIVHLGLAAGFAYHLARMSAEDRGSASKGA